VQGYVLDLRSIRWVCWPPRVEIARPGGSIEGIKLSPPHPCWYSGCQAGNTAGAGQSRPVVVLVKTGFSQCQRNSLRLPAGQQARRAGLARKPSARAWFKSWRGSSTLRHDGDEFAQIPPPRAGATSTSHGIFAGCVGEESEREIFKISNSKDIRPPAKDSSTGAETSWSKQPRTLGQASAKPYNPPAPTFLPALEKPEVRAFTACCLWAISPAFQVALSQLHGLASRPPPGLESSSVVAFSASV